MVTLAAVAAVRCRCQSSAYLQFYIHLRSDGAQFGRRSIPPGELFEIDAQLLALLVEMASFQPQRLGSLRNLAGVPLQFRQYLGSLKD